MEYLKLFEGYDREYEKISSVLYNELLYGHYSVFDFEEDVAFWYMNRELFSISNDVNRIEKMANSKLKSDRIEVKFFSNLSHYAPGHYKVKVDDYEDKNLSISLNIYNTSKIGIELSCVYAIIHKLKDEWFIVEFRGLNGYKSMIPTTYYKCDQISGLRSFIKENFNVNIDI